MFWNHHDPATQAWKRQYWNAIFYQNQRQHELAGQSLESVKQQLDEQVETKLLPIRSFTRAEQYHQKYYLQQRPDLIKKLIKPHSDMKSFLDSNVAACANAFLAREISAETLRKRLDHATYSTLSPEELKRTEAILCGSSK